MDAARVSAHGDSTAPASREVASLALAACDVEGAGSACGSSTRRGGGGGSAHETTTPAITIEHVTAQRTLGSSAGRTTGSSAAVGLL